MDQRAVATPHSVEHAEATSAGTRVVIEQDEPERALDTAPTETAVSPAPAEAASRVDSRPPVEEPADAAEDAASAAPDGDEIPAQVAVADSSPAATTVAIEAASAEGTAARGPMDPADGSPAVSMPIEEPAYSTQELLDLPPAAPEPDRSASGAVAGPDGGDVPRTV